MDTGDGDIPGKAGVTLEAENTLSAASLCVQISLSYESEEENNFSGIKEREMRP